MARGSVVVRDAEAADAAALVHIWEQVAGSVLRFASRSAPGLKAALDVGRSPEVRWLEYDWSLNSKENEL